MIFDFENSDFKNLKCLALCQFTKYSKQIHFFLNQAGLHNPPDSKIYLQGVSYVFGRFYEAVLRSFKIKKNNSSEKFRQLLLKVDKKCFL